MQRIVPDVAAGTGSLKRRVDLPGNEWGAIPAPESVFLALQLAGTIR